MYYSRSNPEYPVLIMLKVSLLFLFSLLTLPLFSQGADLSVRFNAPARSFTESLPLGNGRLGALVYGHTSKERIALNEISLWSGGPQDADREDAWESLKPIQDLLIQGKNKEAQGLLQKHFVAKGRGSGYGNGARDKYGCYQTMGDLYIAWQDSLTPVSDYKRWLDLENATAFTTFSRGKKVLKEEVFTDFVQDITWVRLSSSEKGGIHVAISLYRKENAKIFTERNQVIMEGQLPSGEDPGMRFVTLVQPLHSGGKMYVRGEEVIIEGATECWLKVASVTDYDHTTGTLRREDLLKKASRYLSSTSGFDAARKASVRRYRSFFDRSRFYLPPHSDMTAFTTAERLAKYHAGGIDPQLPALYYNFGRYLMISSSRPGLLPANLQGLWATEYQTPWNGDYHLNINIQMNYWPAELTGLGDLAEPLHRFTANLMPNGRKTAKAYYNAAGWVAHVISNPWFYTSPGEGADWGSTLTGGAWLCQHIWEHYRFTQDKDFLRRYYPVLKDASMFISSILIEEPRHGWLVTAPSNSPEHAYVMPDGTRASTTLGPAMDMQIARELFRATIQASEILQEDAALRSELAAKVKRLAPNRAGAKGDLNEWLEDWEDNEPRHRHVSHLYGLHPYDEINVYETPDLIEAARKTLEMRGDEGTGWSMAWKINFWARLRDGDHALRLLRKLLKPAFGDKVVMHGGGSYPNLFCAHPPFQIDGNFGATAGIAEMLLQSGDNFLEMLPALPGEWKEGKITGLRARGGFTVDMEWEGAQLTGARITSSGGRNCRLRIPPGMQLYDSGKRRVPVKHSEGWTEFSTKKGESYTLR